MANPIIKIKRGVTAPTATLNAGEFAIDQDAKNLYLGVEVGGVTTNEIVGGSGTFATKQFVTDAVNAGTGSLGTMSTQDDDSVAIVGGTINNSVNALFIYGAEISSSPIDNSAIGANIASTGNFTTLTATALDGNIDASTAVVTYGMFQTAVINGTTEITDSIIDSTPIGATTPSTGAFTTLTASSAPSASNDVVRKTDLDSAVSALGSVFHYVGDVSAYTDASNPFELANIVDQSTGAYYRVDVAGTYTAGVGPSMEAKVGDAFVKTTTGWQKLDNVDVEVLPTANEIAVTGDENAGYTVSIDPVFSGRVTTAETDITDLEDKTQNITAIAGETYVAGILTSQELWVGPSSTDAVKLLNPVAGPASVEAPAGKALVIKNGAGNTAFTVIDSGSGRVDFAYDVNVAAILDASVLGAGSASFGSMNVNSSANFNGGINLNTGNLVGNGTNEITDFVIDGGVY